MNSEEGIVSTAAELVAASKAADLHQILVRGSLTNAPSVRLTPGQALCGESTHAEVLFSAGVDGLQLTSDNQVRSIHLRASPDKRAVFNDTRVDGLGHLSLAGVTVAGQVQILAREKVRSGHVEVDGLDIIAADARGASERALRLRRVRDSGRFHAVEHAGRPKAWRSPRYLTGLSAGRIGAPVLGSGIFVSGAGDR